MIHKVTKKNQEVEEKTGKKLGISRSCNDGKEDKRQSRGSGV